MIPGIPFACQFVFYFRFSDIFIIGPQALFNFASSGYHLSLTVHLVILPLARVL